MRRCPVVYEINTSVWLHELSRREGRPVTLGTIPETELKEIASSGFDAVWLMGVWERSAGARAAALTNNNLVCACKQVLPDFTPDDITGSPYAIHNYKVDKTIGDQQQLAQLRERLRSYGILLILDFVGNHYAFDHVWVKRFPECFMQGTPALVQANPDRYFRAQTKNGEQIFAHGRDPYFGPWTDTVQLDIRNPETRSAMTLELLRIADCCDGLRCDMSMLLLRHVFLEMWGGAFVPHDAEFWPSAIAAVKVKYPEFLFIAEVYWDLEGEMLNNGFDFTYGKRLYDVLLGHDIPGIKRELDTDPVVQHHFVHFVENHDEQRAAQAFGPEYAKTAALLTYTLPGMKLVYLGQIEGKRIRIPVQLKRGCDEVVDRNMKHFYEMLFDCIDLKPMHEGQWKPLRTMETIPGDANAGQVVAYCWIIEKEICLVAVNLGSQAASASLQLDIPQLSKGSWALRELMTGEPSEAEIAFAGDPMKLEFKGYGYRLFVLQRN